MFPLSIYQTVIPLKGSSQDKARIHIHAHIHVHSSYLAPRPPEEKRSTPRPNTEHQVIHTSGGEGGGRIHHRVLRG